VALKWFCTKDYKPKIGKLIIARWRQKYTPPEFIYFIAKVQKTETGAYQLYDPNYNIIYPSSDCDCWAYCPDLEVNECDIKRKKGKVGNKIRRKIK
jgi:Pyruvate/2-oxoacid:ferredoxin oxidoreductase delta subunit